MLKELLLEISNANYLSKLGLAEKLNLPVGLVEDGLEQLVRLGYLQEDGDVQDCGLPCGKCPYASMCRTTPLKTVSLTDKGKDLLAEH